ncbi:MAG: hypothetical protein JNM85_08470 [Chthonomonas sp.]|nr:hypothetical protein [Chthonomonas sp.]
MKKSKLFLVLLSFVLTLAAVIGCGGGAAYAPKVDIAVGKTFSIGGGGTQTVLAGANGVFAFTATSLLTAEARSSDLITWSVVEGLPAGATYSFSPNPSAFGEQTNLTIFTTPETPAGSYPFRVRATLGDLVVEISALLNVNTPPPAKSFMLTGSAPETVNQGDDANFTIIPVETTDQTARSNDPVELTVTSGLPTGTTAAFSFTSVNVGSASTLAVSVGFNTVPGTYPITVTGTQGTTVRTTTVSLTVLPVYGLSGSTSQTILPGDSASFTVTASGPLNRSSTAVTLTSSSNLPNGSTITLTPNDIAVGSSSTVLVNTPNGIAPGTYTITVSGDFAGVQRSTDLTLIVAAPPDFTMINEGPYFVTINESVDTNVFTFMNGSTSPAPFSRAADDVTLSVTGGLGTGMTTSFSANPIQIGGQSTLTVNTTFATAPGDYQIVVTGTSPYYTHTTTITVTVVEPSG